MHIEVECEQCSTLIEAEPPACGQTHPCPVCGKTIMVPEAELADGTHLGGFVLRWQLGCGKTAKVFRGCQESLNRPAAVRVLKAELTAHAPMANAFLTAAHLVAKLDHPTLVGILEAGKDHDHAYLASSFIDGDTLAERLTSRPFSEREGLTHVRAVFEALDYAWSRLEMPHLAIKPGNIMIDYHNNAKLLDYGVTGAVLDTAIRTGHEPILGVEEYLSPEQIQFRKDVDFRADQYALGVVLYELLTGTPPYRGETPEDTLLLHLSGRLEAIPLRAPERVVSRDCRDLVSRLLEKDPEKRFRSHRQAIRAIDDILSPAAKTAIIGPSTATTRKKTKSSEVVNIANRRTSDPEPAAVLEKQPVDAREGSRPNRPEKLDKNVKYDKAKKSDNSGKTSEWRRRRQRNRLDDNPMEYGILRQLGVKGVLVLVAMLLTLGGAGVYILRQNSDKPADFVKMSDEELAKYLASRPKPKDED